MVIQVRDHDPLHRAAHVSSLGVTGRHAHLIDPRRQRSMVIVDDSRSVPLSAIEWI